MRGQFRKPCAILKTRSDGHPPRRGGKLTLQDGSPLFGKHASRLAARTAR
jgi:hypothetical protein